MSIKKHSILPYILVRSSTQNIKELYYLKSEKILKKIDQINIFENRIDKLIRESSNILYKIIPRVENKSHRNLLLTVKRSLRLNKYISIQRVESIRRIPKSRLIKNIYKINDLKKILESLKIHYHDIFTHLIKKEKTFIVQQIVQNRDLTKGILLSNPSIYDYLYTQNDKILLTFLKYIVRAYTKTSPFSSFTKVGVLNIQNKNVPIKNKRLVRLNIHFLKIIEQLFSEHPSLYRVLTVQINNTIKVESEYVTFLQIKDHQEIFQTIKSTFLLKYIYIKLKSQHMTFDELIMDLKNETKKSKKFLYAYLRRLIHFGFITLNFDISIYDTEWEDKLLDFLEKHTEESAIKKIIPPIKKIIIIKKTFIENVEFKINIQYELCKEFSKVLKILNLDSSLLASINKYPFIYEDVAFHSNLLINKNHLRDLNQSLIAYVNCLLVNEKFQEVKTNLKDFFISTYSEDASVDFLTLYKSYQNIKLKKQDMPADNEIYNIFLQDYIQKGLNLPDELNFHLNYVTKQDNISFSFFIQRFTVNKNPYYVLNNITSGNGKAFGRFLDLFDMQVTDSILKSTRSQYPNSIVIENHDTIYSNLFFKPTITDREIFLPGYFLLDEAKSISLLDIEVRLDKNSDNLTLHYKNKNKQIVMLNLDLIHIDYRDPIFKFLNLFSPQRYVTLSSPLKQINQHYKRTEKNITKFPRIVINNNLVVQRKKWIVPKNLIPQKKYNESLEEYFLKVNNWRNSLNLPQEVFIALSREDKVIKDADLFKPQYIDFSTPLLIDVFNKLVQKLSSTIEITEMLPNSSMINKKDHNNKVVEFVLQCQL